MSTTGEPATATDGDPAIAPSDDSATRLGVAAAGLGRAWIGLLDVELALARHSLRWLLIGAIAVPVVGLSAWLGLSALLVAVLQVGTSSWWLALLIGTGVQLLALTLLLHRLRRWARDLMLPQTRAALVHAMARLS